LPPGKTIIITEGALKADVLVSLRPKARVIATSGVSCSHPEIIDAARNYNALIAFDADYKTNPAVARQLARLIAAREQDIAAHHLNTTTRIVTWQRYKGIDDAVLAHVPLETMSILQWTLTFEGRTLGFGAASRMTPGYAHATWDTMVTAVATLEQPSPLKQISLVADEGIQKEGQERRVG
jgi:hypothetical protein